MRSISIWSYTSSCKQCSRLECYKTWAENLRGSYYHIVYLARQAIEKLTLSLWSSLLGWNYTIENSLQVLTSCSMSCQRHVITDIKSQTLSVKSSAERIRILASSIRELFGNYYQNNRIETGIWVFLSCHGQTSRVGHIQKMLLEGRFSCLWKNIFQNG